MRAASALHQSRRCLLLVLLLIPWSGPAGAQVTEVVVGVTPVCPYGISACWPGASEALARLEGIDSVAQAPDVYNCTATVSLKHKGLPGLSQWPGQFKSLVGDVFIFRGVEVTVRASAHAQDGRLVLRIPGIEGDVTLAPLENKLQWNFKKGAARQPEPDEKDAHQHLAAKLRGASPGPLEVEVTGPLRNVDRGFVLEVREFFVVAPNKGPQ